jgi:hypothetical protein
VIFVVLLAALLTPLIGGRKVAGTAGPLLIPPAPQVGDCLLHVPAAAGADPAAQTVSCSSGHDAEVIIATATVIGYPTRKRGGGEVPDVAACANTAYWYLGVHPPDLTGERSAVLGPWWPAFSADFALLTPGPLQLRIDQSWVACVLVSQHGLITGSTAHLYGGPPRSSPIPLCSQDREIVLYVAVRCDQPHTTEIMGWRVADESTYAQGSFDQSCAELAQRITGMTDPTAQGALTSTVEFVRSSDGVIHQGWGPNAPAPYRAACTISSAEPRLLSGTLTGLGNAPVPWS